MRSVQGFELSTPFGQVEVRGQALIEVSRRKLIVRAVSGEARIVKDSQSYPLQAGQRRVAYSERGIQPARSGRARAPGWLKRLERLWTGARAGSGPTPGSPPPAWRGLPSHQVAARPCVHALQGPIGR